MLSRGSLEGFSSSLRISVRVISPTPSSSESFFFSLSVILCEREPVEAPSLAAPLLSFAFEAALFLLLAFVSSSTTARLLPASAAARAAPIAVLVFLITTCLGFFLGAGLFSGRAAGFSRTALAAFFCAARTSSNVIPSLSISLSVASYDSGCTLVASSGFSPSAILRNPAHCSYALGPSFGTLRSSSLLLNLPFSSL